MKVYKIAGDFYDSLGLKKPSPIKSVDPPSEENITLTLYRSMDIDLNKFPDKFELSNLKSEQQSIWFDQSFNKAKSFGGEYILTYPLEVIKHYEVVHLEDGESYERVPAEIDKKSIPTEDCKYFGKIELPDGWFWSYKNAKHIVCKKPITVYKSMFQKNVDE